VDRFEVTVGLLRRGLAERADLMRAEQPGAWLPRWTAGEPLSRAIRQAHKLGGQIAAVRLDDRYAWALVDDAVHRIAVVDGTVHRLRLEGPYRYHLAAVFDGDTVAAVDDDQLRVWDLRTGRLLLATDPDDIPRPAGALCSLAVGAGVAVTGTDRGYLLQWDLRDGTRLAKIAAHDGYVRRVAISTQQPQAVLSIGGHNHSTVSFHDLDGLRRTGAAAISGQLCGGGWTSLDGQRRAVTVDEDGLLTVWDPVAAVPLARFPAADKPTGTLAFTANGARAVVGDAQVLQVVDLRDGTIHGTLRTDFELDVHDIAVCGPLVFAGQFGSSQGRVNLIELTVPLVHDARHRPHFVDAVTAMADGQLAVVAVDRDGLFRVFDAADGRQMGQPYGQQHTAESPRRLVTATIDGRDLVTCMFNLGPTSLDPTTGQVCTGPQPATTGPVMTDAAAHDGLVAAIDAGGTLTIWDAATLIPRAVTRAATPGEITAIAVGELHGHTVVLAGAQDGGIRWFNSADLTEIPAPGRFADRQSPTANALDPMYWPGPDAVTALHVTGTVVVSATANTVTCTRITTGEPAGPDLIHPDHVRAVLPAALDAIPVIATSCTDRILRIWEIKTGRVIQAITLPRPADHIVAITSEQIIILDHGYLLTVDAAGDTQPTTTPTTTTPGQHTAKHPPPS
jgi:WD40 repeat protein